MRPLHLSIEGLRSYQDRREIDFTDKSLFAIIGKTGAGKSSILEAIFCALYAGATYNLRAPNTLIADNAPFARVELTFASQGRRWFVRRILARTGTPRHELVCLDEPELRFDKKTDVAAQITKLIGLTAQQFLKTILLPQGRFQEFLHADSSERTPILKTLLGLDTLTTIGQHATAAANRIKPGLAVLESSLTQLHGDPPAWAAACRTAVKDAATHHTRLAETEHAIRDLRQSVTDTRNEATALSRAAAQLTELHPVDGPAQMRALITARQTHDEAITHQEACVEAARVLRDHLDALGLDADRDERGLDRYLHLRAQISPAKDRVDELRARRERHAANQADLHDQDRDLDNRRRECEEFTAEAGEAKEALRVAEAEYAHACVAKQQAADHLGQLRRDQATLMQLAEQLVGNEKELAALHVELNESETVLGQRTGERDAARALYEDALRASAAQHLAAHCHPGDPCPVCQHPIPETFTTPDVPDESAAKKARDHAERALGKITEGHARLTGAAHALGVSLPKLRESYEHRTRDYTAAADALATALRCTDLDAPDETLLSGLESEVTRTFALKEEAEKRAFETALQAKSAADKLGTDRTAHGKAQEAHRSEAAKLESHWNKLQTGLTEFGLVVTDLDEVTEAVFAEQTSKIETNIALAKNLRDELAKADAILNGEQLTLGRLQTERANNVNLPMEQLNGALGRVGAVLATVPADLGLSATSTAPTGGDDRLAWAEQIDRDVALVRAAARDAETRAANIGKGATTREAELLASIDSDRYEDLPKKIQDANTRKTLAERDLGEAERQIPIRHDLTHRIGELRPLYDALEDIRKAMSDGAFPAAAIAQRQHRFLELATGHLADMTAMRFGFAEDFSIVDGLTSQARDTKTLSGGETFMASLALALAVVDMAGRSGGHVETFILDEGFGTLDQEALSNALDVLGHQTIGGRLVAIISHMADVVDEIDDVLIVNRTNAGSTATWLTPEERKRLTDGGYPDLLG
ncbi:AAA family ATPase [Micromonospora trifolii]|uniref:AAA family ATPase n=1 Tax=Micromonospora trifolii TaxID=2911208 RepID=UPI003CEA1931